MQIENGSHRRQAMQATVTNRRLQHHRIWLIAVVVVLLGILATGSAVMMAGDDAIPATINARPVIDSKTIDNARFMEMNALPAAPAAPVMTFEQIRFREINTLPGDNAPLIAPYSDRPTGRY
jgi:hypothetical protein